MRSEQVEFSGSQDTRLAGRLDLPDAPPQAFALFAHCFTCSKDVLAASRIAQALTGFGIAVLRFDFTGLGGSDGDFANTNFSSNVADLVNAAGYLRSHHQAPTILVGHSLGGAAVLAAAEQVPEIRAVATIGAPAGTEHLLHLLGESRQEIERAGEAEVCLAERPFRIRKQFLDDITSQPQADRIRGLGAALLVMHSPSDETVGIDNARRIFDAARHPKSFVSLDGADHLLTRPADARFAASMLAAWASRYLDDDTPPAPRSASAPSAVVSEEGLVVVSENGRGQYGQRITVGGHVLSADEPAPVGQDTGPSPYDLLLAGLGACTSMTLRMYAARKQWPLDNVTVSLRHSRIHAKDCADCATQSGQSGQLDRVDRVIQLTGDLDTEQRRRLLEIADRCPVHRTLHAEVDVRTTLVSDDAAPEVAEGLTAATIAAPA
ncbi:MAG: OsmC family protein [Nocardioidaceae bacterium]|nr:OsmC family protein [Nocardioidaceae bacterium]